MTTSRLIFLQVVLVLGLGAVFFLPKVVNSTPQGIELALPTYVGDWYGEDQAVTEKEREILAKDTEFARKLYTDGRGDQIYTSIVLSGQDLDNSIHRPERCLPAQGLSIADSRVVTIPVSTSAKNELKATRLHNVRKVALKDGTTVQVYNLTYYWFVGWKVTTPSHLERTYMDIRDRVLYGYNQRWAYITVASTITKDLQKFGKDEPETDAMIQNFIRDLLPQISAPPKDQ
ncbi:MAG: exosortase C-terminal domain/associated protein EpsI, partial [Chthoniobacterales bacterium]